MDPPGKGGHRAHVSVGGRETSLDVPIQATQCRSEYPDVFSAGWGDGRVRWMRRTGRERRRICLLPVTFVIPVSEGAQDHLL